MGTDGVRRKVVLSRPPEPRIMLRPSGLGPAGRILEWLGHGDGRPRREEELPKRLALAPRRERPAVRPVKVAKPQKAARLHAKGALVAAVDSRVRAVNALRTGEDLPQCAPEATARTRVPQSPRSVSSVSPSRTKSPARKRRRTTSAELAKSGEAGAFQAAVLQRLRKLCGEHEDAKVLAEYIVVMVAGNRGREEMALELKPFFPDQAQAEAFVEWIEQCKCKSFAGDSPSLSSGQEGRASAQTSLEDVRTTPPISRPPAGTSAAPVIVRAATLTPNSEFRGAQPAPVRPGPHVAVTTRCVLQPNPDFEVPPPTEGGDEQWQGRSDTSPLAHAAPMPVMRPVPVTVPTPGARPVAMNVNAGKREKNELLENMTKQLQLILARLSDKGLNDETREKYQALAQNIQVQMAKISKPQRRRLS